MVSANCATGYAQDTSSAYINGNIYTVDPDRPWVEAVAIRNGRFLVVGSNEEVEKAIDSTAEVIDLKGKMAMPGMHDGHSHFLEGGRKSLYECVLETSDSLPDIRSQLADCKPRVRGDPPWLVVFVDFYIPHLEGFNRGFLDSIYPDIPVYIREHSYHNALVNSKALEIAGISRDTPDPAGGRFDRDPGTGELTGLLVDIAMAPVLRAIPRLSTAEDEEAGRWVTGFYSSFGFTSLQYSGVTGTQLKTLARLEGSGDLQQYVSAHILSGDTIIGRATENLTDIRQEYRSELVNPEALKVFLDGIPAPPYFTHVGIQDDRIDRGNLLVDEDALTRELVARESSGMRVKMHAAGEGASRVAIDIYARVREANPGSRPSLELGHSGAISTADIGRLAELGVVAEMSPAFGGWGGGATEMAASTWRFQTLLEAGTLVTGGSDYPVISSPNPFPWIELMLTRPYEAIDLASAILILTRNGASAIGRAEESGSIEPGKLADMIVLDQNLFEISPDRIGETRVLRTVFRGKPVYIDE